MGTPLRFTYSLPSGKGLCYLISPKRRTREACSRFSCHDTPGGKAPAGQRSRSRSGTRERTQRSVAGHTTASQGWQKRLCWRSRQLTVSSLAFPGMSTGPHSPAQIAGSVRGSPSPSRSSPCQGGTHAPAPPLPARSALRPLRRLLQRGLAASTKPPGKARNPSGSGRGSSSRPARRERRAVAVPPARRGVSLAAARRAGGSAAAAREDASGLAGAGAGAGPGRGRPGLGALRRLGGRGREPGRLPVPGHGAAAAQPLPRAAPGAAAARDGAEDAAGAAGAGPVPTGRAGAGPGAASPRPAGGRGWPPGFVFGPAGQGELLASPGSFLEKLELLRYF